METEEAAVCFYATQLRLCRDSGDLSQCKRIHAEVLESPYHRNKYLRNLLVEMYGGCGSVHHARSVFDSISAPNLYSWNIMIKVYVQNGFADEAVELYRRMQAEKVDGDAYTYASILGACSDLGLGREIHSEIVEHRLESQVIVGTGLINMYARCSSLKDARDVFDRIAERNVVTWTSMVAAYAHSGHLLEAKAMFDIMPNPRDFAQNLMITAFAESGELDQAKSLYDSLAEPDIVARTSMLVAYARGGELGQSRRMFDEMTERNVVSWNAMIAAYARIGDLREARHLFDRMPRRDTVSWTCMLTAYARQRNMLEAGKLFEQLKERDIVSWNAMLAGYSLNGDIEQAKGFFERIPGKDIVSWNTLLGAYALHGHIEQAESLFREMPRQDIISWNTMITSYAFNGHLDKAEEMFERMPVKNIVSWNIMIVALAENGRAKESIKLVVRMDLEGIQTDKYTFISIFNACTSLAAAEEGRAVHLSIVEAGLLFDAALGDSLVNMYAKSGSVREAKALFDSISKEVVDVEAWNSMMAACSQGGLGSEVVELFRTLELQGLQPNDISFIRVLSGCSHAGLMEDGRNYFVSIATDYVKELTMDHYLCMVDMFARSGKLEQAKELLNHMPYEPNIIAWMTVLAACSNHRDSASGIESARQILQLDPQTSAPFILLSNIFKQVGGASFLKSTLEEPFRLKTEKQKSFRQFSKFNNVQFQAHVCPIYV